MRQLLGPTWDTAVVAQHFVSLDPSFPFSEMQVRMRGPNHCWSILGKIMYKSASPASKSHQCGGCKLLEPSGDLAARKAA